MPTKDYILDNVAGYKAENLYGFINKGLVTFDELCNDTNGEFSPKVRQELKRMLEHGDDDEWASAQAAHTIEAVQHYLDTFAEGKFRPQARALKAQIEREQADASAQKSAESAWKALDKNDIDALNDFVTNNPDSVHAAEATQRINDLLLDSIMDYDIDTLIDKIKQILNEAGTSASYKNDNIANEIKSYIKKRYATKAQFLDKLREDCNLLNASAVKHLIDEHIITIADLSGIGIGKQFIKAMLTGLQTDSYTYTRSLDRIHKQSTEVYFWGIPSSGKSCALGAILSVAGSGKVAKVMDADTASQGYGYMTYLTSHFPQNGEVGTLLGGTPIDAFYEMGFDLTDESNRTHPITCIDMAGELMRCMYKSNANMPLSDTDLNMLDTMTKVLIDNRSTNRKIHFFVIEYGGEDRIFDGYHQDVYLNGALSYIKDTGIFKKETDAIFIMVTKVDKMKHVTRDAITQYVKDNYEGFYNGLNKICEDNEINGKKVEIVAFSLGKVCFQSYCKFDTKPAENVVDIMLKHSASNHGGKLGIIGKIFRG
ncbi:hypothetical protein [Prevotellamassilia timonensis]|uniref:hypothetical protein n=1 Tax=Prevotellamassilia timonensis TaxID=1852370 RepID=UPI00307995E4